MLKNLLLCIILCLLFQPIVEINCHALLSYPRKPFAKADTATLIDNKLYFLGGSITTGKEFFYLDLSVAFNTQELLWVDLLNIYTVPTLWGATSVKGGANNNTFFLYGGYSYDNATSLVYTYEPQNNTWNTPNINGINTIKKRSLTGVVDYNKKMYLWSGLKGPIDEVTGKFDGHMLILDTVNLSWGQGSIIGAPIPRIHYGATLLPNQKIIYIGGRNAFGAVVPLRMVHLYDTVNDNWIKIATSGNVPSRRYRFSTILGLDGQKIIIFGGLSAPSTEALFPSTEALYVLDLNNFKWSIPKISGQIPNSRCDHNANVIGKYMIISFGYGYNQSIESDVLLLDISNNDEYIWTDEFIPSITKSPLSNNPALIGSIIGSSIFVVLLVGSLLLCKLKRNRKKINPVLGNEEENNHKNENLESKRNEGQEGTLPINEREILQVPKNAIITKQIY